MLAVARALPPPPGAPITWHEGSALDLPFADAEFDAVICQQGVQFFPDLGRAPSEMARVAAPGARASVSFWAALDEQTYLRAQIEALGRAIGDSVTPFLGAFRLDLTRVRDAFLAAGFREATAGKVTAVVPLPPLEHFAAGQVGTLPVAPAFAALAEEQHRVYVDELQRVLSRYRTADGTYACPFVSWIVTAMR